MFPEHPRIYKNESRTEYLCFADFILARDILHRWSKNRPVDPIRVSDIAQAIREKGYIDGTINVAHVRGEGYVIWDGLHRFEALKLLTDEERPTTVVYHVITNITEEELMDRFIALNNSIPVPSLYTESNDELTKRMLENIVNRLMIQYKAHFVSSKRPQEPNVNRDQLLERMTQRLTGITVTEQYLLNKIMEHNDKIKNRIVHSDIVISISTNLKCSKNNCFLFLKACPVWELEL